MNQRTRGEMEAELTQAIVKFEKDYLGRGPLDARTYFVHDMALIRLQGILDASDRKLAETPDGQALVKETRRKLFEVSRHLFDEMVEHILGCKLICFHTDMSTKTGERIIVLTVDVNLDKLYR